MEDRQCGAGIVPSSLEGFASRLALICGSAAAGDVLETMRAPKRTGYVVNTLLDPVEEPPGTPVPGLAGCFSVAPDARTSLLEHPAVSDGRFYPMNPASVLAARALSARGGMEVLDLAAAPGGKTLLLAMEMSNRERIAAVEPVKARFHRMRANLARCGVTNVQFYAADGRSIGRKVPGRFDRVLFGSPHPAGGSSDLWPLEAAQDP
jgi:16S rRNA C967 or C1407 C5-methylase (RsmB/RsmF family)